MASTTPTSATADTPKLLKKAGPGEAKVANSIAQTSFGCSHIKGLLQGAREKALEGYGKVIAALQKADNVCDRYHKSATGVSASTRVTYLCLQCPNVNVSRERHRKEHGFSVESSSGYVWCHDCRDFVYDPALEAIRAPNLKKRKHPSTFDDEDKSLILQNSTATPCAAIGLRGLYNMGQTCFMSVILQSLIHNPFIRTYYLSEGHRAIDCDREACTSCALDYMFNDFFGQEKHEGYGAVHMLQGCWKGGGGLAGYSQQDAHEYLGFILNSLHEANCEEEETRDSKDCLCVIHQTFGGLLKSTVTCLTCKNTTTALDPFMDLSLDVKNSSFSIKKKKLALIGGTQTIKETLPMDLTECLDRFTSAETLSGDSYHCRKCDASQEAKKKLGLARLPPVIPIHLKRFSHSKTSSQSNKVDTKVRFPFTLDLSPYLVSLPTKKSSTTTNGHRTDKLSEDSASKSSGPDDEDSIEPQDPVYELSSVVVHKGKIDNGHYISYSKQGPAWFRFDDSMVVEVDEKEVLGAEAYMLFYVLAEI